MALVSRATLSALAFVAVATRAGESEALPRPADLDAAIAGRLLGQWSMLAKLRSVPDTAVEFTGYSLERDVIAGQFPGAAPALSDDPGVDTTNLVHAADIWYSIKKQWCLEGRRLLVAKRALQ